MRIEVSTEKPARRWWLSAAAIRFAVLSLLVVGLFVGMIGAGPSRQTLVDYLSVSHPFAPAIAIFGSAVLTTVLVPRTLLSAVGGVVFGFLSGAGYILLGVTLGAIVAHTIGRLLGREFMIRHLRGRLLHIEQAISTRGISAVVISRLIPFVPFCASNYLFGTTRVRLLPFVGGTVLGALPATLAYAALGSATARGDHAGMTVAGAVVIALGISGWIGTFLVWRRRPRKPAAAQRVAAA